MFQPFPPYAQFIAGQGPAPIHYPPPIAPIPTHPVPSIPRPAHTEPQPKVVVLGKLDVCSTNCLVTVLGLSI